MSGERDAAIRRYLPLVRAIARRIRRLIPGSDVDDLTGDGCVGLIRAIDGYDPARGPTREQYVRCIVLGAMLNGVRRLDPVSERARRTVRHAERDRDALAVARGAFPTERELEARWPGLARARVAAHRGTPLSLDAPVPAGVAVHAGGKDPASTVVAASERSRLSAALDRLPRRQRAILIAHYYEDRPLRALGGELVVSPQRVSQLHLAALARMRTALGAP